MLSRPNGGTDLGYGALVDGTIGQSPLIELDRSLTGGACVYAKCEFLSPTGSHKDRLYKHAIRTLEREGRIRPGMTLIDFSSGNAGAALAMLGTLRGYRVVIVRPSGLSREKAVQILAYGARLVFTPSGLGVPGARKRALALSRRLGAECFLMYQTDSELNRNAYYSCGLEIVRQFQERRRRIDAFVCGIGTGGTLTGASRAIKEYYPRAKIIAVEMKESAVLYQRRRGRPLRLHRHHLEGLSTGELYANLDIRLIDDVVLCSEREAISCQKQITRGAKMLVGPTSGANLFGAKKVAVMLGRRATIVTVFSDSAWKYFSETRLPSSVEQHLTRTKFL